MAELERPNGRATFAARSARPSDEHSAALAWVFKELLRRDSQVWISLEAMRSGRSPSWQWLGRGYRSHLIAAENGIRSAICFLLAAIFFVYAGWPATSASFSLVAVVIGLGSMTPNPRGMTAMALIASPIAIVFAGILEFVVLDGVAEFPLLALAIAPFIIGAALLITSSNRLLSALGRLNLIFIAAIFSPSNPQSYNPQLFLFTSLFVCVATAVLLAAQLLVPPVSNDRRRRLLTAETRRELQMLSGRTLRFAAEEEMFRDAVRIGQIVGSGGASPENTESIEEALSNFDQSSIIRLCDERLRKLTEEPLVQAAAAARAALLDRHPPGMIAAGRTLRDASPDDPFVADLWAALVVASHVVEGSPSRHVEFGEVA